MSIQKLDPAIDEAGRVIALRENLYEKIVALESRQYDWDGNGGLPVRPDVRGMVLNKLLHPAYGMKLVGLTRCQPKFKLHADGSVQLGMSLGKRQLYLLAMCEGVIEYQKYSDNGVYIDGVKRLAHGSLATGYAVEIDELTAWLLEDQSADWEA